MRGSWRPSPTACVDGDRRDAFEKLRDTVAAAYRVHTGYVWRPDWTAHGKAAPFRRNDELLNLLPKGVIAFPGSGIIGNLVDKARQFGIPVHSVAP